MPTHRSDKDETRSVVLPESLTARVRHVDGRTVVDIIPADEVEPSDHAALIEEAPIGTIIGWQTEWYFGLARRAAIGTLNDWEFDDRTIGTGDLIYRLEEATEVDVYVRRSEFEAAEARTAELQAAAWDEGWEAGNRYALAEPWDTRNQKTTNPHRNSTRGQQ